MAEAGTGASDRYVGEALATASAAYRRFADRARGADRARSTRLSGWTVGDLVDHVTWGAAMEADAVRSALGLPGRGVVGVGGNGPADSSALEDAVATFADVATLDVAADTAVVLPAGTVPAAYAGPLFAFEAALHDLDLAHALGDGAAALSASELGACEVVVGPMLDLVARPAPAEEITIDLLGLGEGLRLRTADGGWQRAVPDDRPATTTVRGSAQDIVLFTCGRLGVDAVSVVGDQRHAERFKDHFPGP